MTVNNIRTSGVIYWVQCSVKRANFFFINLHLVWFRRCFRSIRKKKNTKLLIYSTFVDEKWHNDDSPGGCVTCVQCDQPPKDPICPMMLMIWRMSCTPVYFLIGWPVGLWHWLSQAKASQTITTFYLPPSIFCFIFNPAETMHFVSPIKR